MIPPRGQLSDRALWGRDICGPAVGLVRGHLHTRRSAIPDLDPAASAADRAQQL
jgi:hypothetical protein